MSSNGGASGLEEESACWICLEGASAERGLLSRPCACPRDVHLKCLSRWCLQQAGRSEESNCRFCKHELPDWKSVLSGPCLPPADPIMVVTLGNVVHKIRVKPGEQGQREFQQEIRRLFNIPDGVEFEVTFRCKAPCTSDTIQLEGMSSYAAATHCASLMAAQRMAAASNGQSSSSTAPSTSTEPSQAPTIPLPQETDVNRPAGPSSALRTLRGAHSVAAAAAGAMRRMANSMQNAMHVLQGNGTTPPTSAHNTALPTNQQGTGTTANPLVVPTGPAFTARRRHAAASAAPDSTNLPTPTAMDWISAAAADTVPMDVPAAAAGADTFAAPARVRSTRPASTCLQSTSPREGRLRRSRRLGLDDALIRSWADAEPSVTEPSQSSPPTATPPTVFPQDHVRSAPINVAATRRQVANRTLDGPICSSAVPGRMLLASSTGSGMVLDEDVPALAGNSTDEDLAIMGNGDVMMQQEETDRMAVGGGLIKARSGQFPLRRSPRNHPLGVRR